MLLGIDVGGTFTDAVAVKDGAIGAQAKSPTTHQNLLEGILVSLDQVMEGVEPKDVERVSISTTVVTNALVQNQIDKVHLILMPGPGRDITDAIPAAASDVSGYTDHRGRTVAMPREEELKAVCQMPNSSGIFAVSGKFAVRNPEGELAVAQYVRRHAKVEHITLASTISGSLNFVRRTNSAYYNAAVWRQFGVFAAAVREALDQRGITAPVYILKADGGTMPLTLAAEQPVETIFTGPAASVLGIMAMAQPQREAVSLDIGGTTTDIALWHQGIPLFAERGASIDGYPTAVRAFRLKSVGIGGDSYVRTEDGKLKVGPDRQGQAMALGGPQPTLTDAMIVLGLAPFGDRRLAYRAMEIAGLPGSDAAATARQALDLAAAALVRAIDDMVEERACEPVYRVEDIVRGERFTPDMLIGVGGAAQGLAPLAAERLNIPYTVPTGAMVANAVGAAIARPTIDITLRADTSENYLTVAELGVRAPLPSRHFTLNDARRLASEYLTARAAAIGICAQDAETLYEEVFPVVRGFNTTGKIMTIRQQVKPGVLMKLAGREVML